MKRKVIPNELHSEIDCNGNLGAAQDALALEVVGRVGEREMDDAVPPVAVVTYSRARGDAIHRTKQAAPSPGETTKLAPAGRLPDVMTPSETAAANGFRSQAQAVGTPAPALTKATPTAKDWCGSGISLANNQLTVDDSDYCAEILLTALHEPSNVVPAKVNGCICHQVTELA